MCMLEKYIFKNVQTFDVVKYDKQFSIFMVWKNYLKIKPNLKIIWKSSFPPDMLGMYRFFSRNLENKLINERNGIKKNDINMMTNFIIFSPKILKHIFSFPQGGGDFMKTHTQKNISVKVKRYLYSMKNFKTFCSYTFCRPNRNRQI